MSEEIKGLSESGQAPESVGDNAGQMAKGSTDNSSDSGSLIYENKKIRSRAQRAEEERDVLKTQLDKQNEQQLADNENFKQLASDRGDKIKALEEVVGKESEVIGQVMDDLRSQLSEEDRELAEGFDYKKLKSFVNRYGKNNQKIIGTDDSKPGSMVKFEKDIWDMPEKERKANWNTYLQSLVNRKN